MGASRRIDKLAGNADAATRFAQAAFEDVTDAKLPPDLLYVDCASLLGEARIAGDHIQPFHSGQAGNDVLDNAIDEIFLLGIATHVLERQDRDRRLVR